MRFSTLFFIASALSLASAVSPPEAPATPAVPAAPKAPDAPSAPVPSQSPSSRPHRKSKKHSPSHSHHSHRSSSARGNNRQRKHRREVLRERSEQALVQRSLDINNLMDQLLGLHDGLLASQKDLNLSRNRLSKDKSNKLKKNGPFKSQVANDLRNYRDQYKTTTPVINELSSGLADFGREKGLAYYDKDSQLQTVLKDIVDSSKYLLNDVNYLVFKIPTLGPILGPLIYDIKCLLDVLLNGTENTVDHILNDYAGDLKDQNRLMGLSNAGMGMPFVNELPVKSLSLKALPVLGA